MKTLSAYTIAANCTDSTDLNDGINEIIEAMKKCEKEGRSVPYFYGVRLGKLKARLNIIHK